MATAMLSAQFEGSEIRFHPPHPPDPLFLFHQAAFNFSESCLS
jgi:hypothetical protein